VNHDWDKQKIQGAIVEEVEFDTESEGYQIYAGASCIGCHGDAFQGGLGKPLVNTGLTADQIVNIAHEGVGDMPPGTWEGSDEDLQILAEFIEGLKN